MGYKRLNMVIQEEILRLKSLGHSQRKIAKILGIDRGTVIRYWDGPPCESMSPQPAWALLLDWEHIEKELKSASRKIIYGELKESYSLPSYQAFCQYLKNHKISRPPEITIKIDRTPGASIEVDYSGDSIELLNPATGEIYSVELFGGAMSYSGRFYAEFTLTQKLEDFVTAHNNMFTYLGGVASYIIPDNCKTAVTKVDRYDPLINPTYHDMCKHYGIVVDPADGYSPRHKPNVEKAVSYLQTDFLARIRNKTFTSLIDLNRELRSWLKEANAKIIQGRGQSRDHFFKIEMPHLKGLPSSLYEIYYFKKAKVHPDCHFQYNKNYYSVPHHYVGKEIDIKFNQSMVHAYYNCERIATHKAMKGSYHYCTNNSHYPEKKFVEVNYHLAKAKKEAILIGENTTLLINKLINQSRFPLKILRKVQGILRLKKNFDNEALDYACGQALEFNKLNYDNIKRFAKNYKNIPESSYKAPLRDSKLICLQGGLHE
ncbi:MAG: IS21 family transposase [Candidatus Brocadiales bacterium]|nr:IS21 family transposase [Candidatus Brocadiales bacterium]